jgi:nitroimidazol reductase NimA-like FMN-containing flavoprotein (pyridoxamine 5'-phosphate oxidase superfamily)
VLFLLVVYCFGLLKLRAAKFAKASRMDEALRAIIINLLSQHNIMTLATVRPDGFPQATTVYYVNDGLTLYFATDPASQKAGNIKLNNKVSVAIASETQNANKLKALSLSGIAAKVTNPSHVHHAQLSLFKAVPQAKRFSPTDSAQLIVYSITPIVMSLVDYAAGYGKTFPIEVERDLSGAERDARQAISH